MKKQRRIKLHKPLPTCLFFRGLAEALEQAERGRVHAVLCPALHRRDRDETSPCKKRCSVSAVSRDSICAGTRITSRMPIRIASHRRRSQKMPTTKSVPRLDAAADEGVSKTAPFPGTR